MNTIIEILGIVIAVLLAAVIILGAAYTAIVIYHNRRFDKIKSEKYEQHNREEKMP